MQCSRTPIQLLGPLLATVIVGTVASSSACGSQVAGGQGTGAGTSGSGGSGQTTSSATLATSSGSGGGYPGCVDRDPDAMFEMEFDLAQWEPATTTNPYQVDFVATCDLAKLTRSGDTASLALTCEHEERGPTPISATLTLPAGLELPIQVGDRLILVYRGHGTQGEMSPAAAFALKTDGGQILVAGYDVENLDTDPSWGPVLAPLSLGADTKVCPKECLGLPEGRECTEAWGAYARRNGVVISDGEGAAVTVIDGNRAPFSGPSGSFDVVVALAAGDLRAVSHFSYRFLVIRRD